MSQKVKELEKAELGRFNSRSKKVITSIITILNQYRTAYCIAESTVLREITK